LAYIVIGMYSAIQDTEARISRTYRCMRMHIR